jgi:hypothetical protein
MPSLLELQTGYSLHTIAECRDRAEDMTELKVELAPSPDRASIRSSCEITTLNARGFFGNFTVAKILGITKREEEKFTMSL